MKLIIERDKGEFYAYLETKAHFKAVDSQRGKRICPSLLANECTLGLAMRDGEYMVFDVKKKKGCKRWGFYS